MIKKNHYKEFKPDCINDGCGSPVHTRKVNKNGTYDVRTECYKCHMGGRNRPGVTPHKKTYCENKDGRLGIWCEAKIEDSCMLEMDHIDGDRWRSWRYSCTRSRSAFSTSPMRRSPRPPAW